MNTENLMKACDSFDSFFSELREAHTDAVNSENQFAEIALFSLIEQAAQINNQLARVKDAAIQTDADAKKKKTK